jgi:formate hydrogenlyase subunit 3/multisubunit Na+/H+ antiporter MnhD subunit
MELFVEAAGWIAAVLTLLAYALLAAGRFTGDSVSYHLMNIGGGLGILLNSGWNGAYPSAAINVVWVGIGVAALARLARKRKATGT